MGAGASAGLGAAVKAMSDDEVKGLIAGLPSDAKKKLEGALAGNAPKAGTADSLNILLQEDLTIRGGAQLWLMNCGSRLQAAGHNITFLLPTTSLIIEDCEKIAGAKVAKYDPEAIAKSPGDFKAQFTELLTPAQVCVTLVRQQRGEFQNVSFMAQCIKDAGLKTFLIAKTGTPDPSYKTHFYGSPLFKDGQCCVITIAQYTKDYIVENMGVPAELITNVYNGTDTAKFRRTPEMAAEALKRYPCATPENAFVVGCIGSYEERKAQSLLLKAAKKLIADKRLPNIHCLLVGEGPDKEMLSKLIVELGIEKHVSLCDFTKEPFYVFERCALVALPSTGKEGLPNVLLEALAMEKPCVATNKYGMPEVVIDGKTGYVFPSGDIDALADAIVKIGGVSAEEQKKMAQAGKDMVFAEHDKVKQFEKILEIIKEKARGAL
jgi:glycosyltransferase involved in cell wall biosynthesis